jgi:glycosyltransferase involved in cell wall biosynthesis
MRIAFVAPFGLRAKGTARARSLPLARSLAARGHAIALFIPPYDSPSDSGRRWKEGGVDVINISLPRFRAGLPVLVHGCLAWRLLRAVRHWDPDLVHIFKPKGPSGLVGAAIWLVRRRPGAGKDATLYHSCRPLIVVDADDWEGAGGWNDDVRTAYSHPLRCFFAWQERYGLTHADAWTVTSSCLRDRAVEFGADPERVFVLPNGIVASDIPFSARSCSERKASTLLGSDSGRQPSAVLYTRFAGVRVESVAAIWHTVRATVPEARLTVVGRGLAGEEEVLRSVPGVEVLGWVEPSELPSTLAAADLAVVPWADTPSNRARHSVKVLELMAAGLPIVAYAVGELISTVGDAGVLVPPGDEVGFAKAVAALLGDCSLAGRLGAMARRRALEQYTWEKLVETAVLAYDAAEMATGDFQGRGGKWEGHYATHDSQPD